MGNSVKFFSFLGSGSRGGGITSSWGKLGQCMGTSPMLPP